MDNFKPQIKGMKIASHDIDARQFPTHCEVKNRIVFQPTGFNDEKSEPIKEISKFYATVPSDAVITEISARIGAQKISYNWKETIQRHVKKIYPQCQLRENRNWPNEVLNGTFDFSEISVEVEHRNILRSCDLTGTKHSYTYRARHGYYDVKYSQIGNGCKEFIRDLLEIRKYDTTSEVICAITYQMPEMWIISKRDNFVKSVRIRAPAEIDPQDAPVISAKLEKMKICRKNRALANVDGVQIDAKIVKNTKVGKKSKHNKQRRITADLDYDLSEYYSDY